MNSEEYFKAKKMLSEFLNEHPEAKPIQEVIESKLNKANNQHNRLAIMQDLLYTAYHELVNKLKQY